MVQQFRGRKVCLVIDNMAEGGCCRRVLVMLNQARSRWGDDFMSVLSRRTVSAANAKISKRGGSCCCWAAVRLFLNQGAAGGSTGWVVHPPDKQVEQQSWASACASYLQKQKNVWGGCKGLLFLKTTVSTTDFVRCWATTSRLNSFTAPYH